MERPKQDMDEATFRRCIEHVKHYMQHGNQTELNLAGIGESTMHPDFIKYLEIAREELGYELPMLIATNGVSLTEEHARAMSMLKVRAYVSAHRPEKAGLARALLIKYGAFIGDSLDPSIAPINWAGQVDWACDNPVIGSACPWLTIGRVIAFADGRVSRCCLDSTGEGVIGHVNDEIGRWETGPWKLCEGCHHAVPGRCDA
jgi:hypothetical protein